MSAAADPGAPPPPDARWLYLLVAGFSATIVIACLSLVLTRGGHAAVLLLDFQTPARQGFPYPFTIQNLLWLALALGIGDVAYRWSFSGRERRALTARLLPEDDRTLLTPDKLSALRKRILEAKFATPSFLCELLDECVLYFHANRSPSQTQQVMASLVDLELHRVDLRYTLLRYLAWLIPTLGFIGTVVGIASALTALEGKEGASMGTIEVAIPYLALAFNTTIVALCFSAVLVLLIHAAQKKEEDAINDSSRYCLRNLINRLYIPE